MHPPKTFVKWSGNKSKMIKHIVPHIPEYNTYYEPFLGSGALFLHLTPSKWVINDMNPELCHLWMALQTNMDGFLQCFRAYVKRLCKLNKDELLIMCKKHTERLNHHTTQSMKRCASYLIMKNLAYNGHIYFRDRFKFYTFDLNIHSYAHIYVFSPKYEENLRAIATYLRQSHGTIHQQDYRDILKRCKKGDFVFLDPPYVEHHDYQFVYNREERLDDTFLRTLWAEVKKLDRKQVKWLMTQADTPRIRQLFRDYNIIPVPVYRMPKRRFVHELIIMNYIKRNETIYSLVWKQDQ